MIKQWNALYELLKRHPIPGVSLSKHPGHYNLTESFNGTTIFDYDRFIDGGRATNTDLTGFIGLASLSLKTPIIITEGVSDFITAKVNTDYDVLGQTNLNLNKKQLFTLKELNKSIIIIGDNDVTGVSEVFKKRLSLITMGLTVKVIIPSPYKDLTEGWLQDPNFPKEIIK